MIEVFKTNVNDSGQAAILIDRILLKFPAYHTSFDLEDCDRILRVKTSDGSVDVHGIIQLLDQVGLSAEVLNDDIATQVF